MRDDLVSRLRQDAEMLQDGPQSNLTKLWHSEVVKDAAKDCQEAAQALTEARAEIERLRAKPPLLDAQSLPGVDALVKTLEAQLDEALRSCLAEREGRLKAESELSTLRARAEKAESALAEAVEVLRPFADEAAKYDPDEGDSHEHAWGRLDLTIGHLRAARRVIKSQEPAEQEK